jgi:hypothetical protein
MKKVILAILIAVMVSSPFVVKAETNDLSVQLAIQLEEFRQVLIQKLLEQVAVLQAQLAELLAIQKNQQATLDTIKATPVVEPLVISCTILPNPVPKNRPVTFTANVSGGNGIYNYSWSGACDEIIGNKTCSRIKLGNNYTNTPSNLGSGNFGETILRVTSGSQVRQTSCGELIVAVE